jgi:hypothetical protein
MYFDEFCTSRDFGFLNSVLTKIFEIDSIFLEFFILLFKFFKKLNLIHRSFNPCLCGHALVIGERGRRVPLVVDSRWVDDARTRRGISAHAHPCAPDLPTRFWPDRLCLFLSGEARGGALIQSLTAKHCQG